MRYIHAHLYILHTFHQPRRKINYKHADLNNCANKTEKNNLCYGALGLHVAKVEKSTTSHGGPKLLHILMTRSEKNVDLTVQLQRRFNIL